WGAATDDVWLLAGGKLQHFDGTIWSLATTPALGDPPPTAIGGTSGHDVWVAASNHFLHWDGASWTLSARTPAPADAPQQPTVSASAGSGANDVWAVGGSIEHYDGQTWRTLADQVITSNPDTRLTGVWAAGPRDAWAVQRQHLLHWDGTAWTSALDAKDY